MTRKKMSSPLSKYRANRAIDGFYERIDSVDGVECLTAQFFPTIRAVVRWVDELIRDEVLDGLLALWA